MATRADVRRLVRERRRVDTELGDVLAELASTRSSSRAALVADVISIGPGSDVAVRIAKRGLVYSFALNLSALTFNESNFYPLLLSIGFNELSWTLAATKPIWAFQIDLVVDGIPRILSQGQSSVSSAPPGFQKQILEVS